jgi:GT2 family glycosyltransferase
MSISTDYHLHLLIIHYRNPCALRTTLANLSQVFSNAQSITVFDNDSGYLYDQELQQICVARDVSLRRSLVNLGWGKAINEFLISREWSGNDLLVVSAHDAIVVTADVESVVREFDDARVMFVTANYPTPSAVSYSLARSFEVKAIAQQTRSRVEIGHATLLLARPTGLATLLFDEEYFIYGCESEIFLRASEAGFLTIATDQMTVENPSTDASSAFRTFAFTVNSLYSARIRGGAYGVVVRSGVIIASIVFAAARGRITEAVHKLRGLILGIRSGCRGLRVVTMRHSRSEGEAHGTN